MSRQTIQIGLVWGLFLLFFIFFVGGKDTREDESNKEGLGDECDQGA